MLILHNFLKHEKCLRAQVKILHFSVFVIFMFSSVKYIILLYLECHQGLEYDKDVVISRFSSETWEHANLARPAYDHSHPS